MSSVIKRTHALLSKNINNSMQLLFIKEELVHYYMVVIDFSLPCKGNTVAGDCSVV